MPGLYTGQYILRGPLWAQPTALVAAITSSSPLFCGPSDISVTAPAPVVNTPIEGSAGEPFWEPGASHLCSSQGLVETMRWGVGERYGQVPPL